MVRGDRLRRRVTGRSWESRSHSHSVHGPACARDTHRHARREGRRRHRRRPGTATATGWNGARGSGGHDGHNTRAHLPRANLEVRRRRALVYGYASARTRRGLARATRTLCRYVFYCPGDFCASPIPIVIVFGSHGRLGPSPLPPSCPPRPRYYLFIYSSVVFADNVLRARVITGDAFAYRSIIETCYSTRILMVRKLGSV